MADVTVTINGTSHIIPATSWVGMRGRDGITVWSSYAEAEDAITGVLAGKREFSTIVNALTASRTQGHITDSEMISRWGETGLMPEKDLAEYLANYNRITDPDPDPLNPDEMHRQMAAEEPGMTDEEILAWGRETGHDESYSVEYLRKHYRGEG